MKKRHILSLLLCVSMFFCFFTVPVYAISQTNYYTLPPETYTGFRYKKNGSFPQYSYLFVNSYNNVPMDCFLVFKSSNLDGLCLVFISDTSGGKRRYSFQTSPTNTSNGGYNSSLQYDSTHGVYYDLVFMDSDYRWVNTNNNTNYLINSNIYDMSSNAILSFVLEHRVNPIDWGSPNDVSISTNYAGNVERSPANVDKITWNNHQDTNGNSYITHIDQHPVVEVQAVPVTWKTSTREEMENNAGNPTIGTGVPIDSYNARTGHLEITWQEVIDYLQIEYANIYSYLFDGEYWISKGWYYQYRLVADDYIGEWHTLSNGLNLSPTKSKRLVQDPYDENIYNILKEISETNNQTTTIYEYGDNNYITINNDPSSGWQDPDGGGSFWDFLASVVKAISDGIASIVSSVTSLVGDLVNGILGLFTFDTFEINNYNTEVQTLKDNSGIFGQSIEFADSIKDSIRGVEQQPAVLHFDGIVINNVQLIPAVDLDFDQMVVDAGLTDFHNLVYVFTDGAILISLIIMVHHKIMEVLHK